MSEHKYDCERCHDSGYVYPGGSCGTRDDDIPCPECSPKWRQR